MKNTIAALSVFLVLFLAECVLGASQSVVPRTDQSPSFDCTRARSASERLICADAELARLDNELGRAFRSQRRPLRGASRVAFVDQQRKWINERDAQCGLEGLSDAPPHILVQAKPCMVQATEARIQHLSGVSKPNPEQQLADLVSGKDSTASPASTAMKEEQAASAPVASLGASQSIVPRTDQSPSFDCTRARSASERLICADAELARLDNELGRAFRSQRRPLRGASRVAFVDQQRKWINERDAQCGLEGLSDAPPHILVQAKPCMVQATEARIQHLSGVSKPNPEQQLADLVSGKDLLRPQPRQQ